MVKFILVYRISARVEQLNCYAEYILVKKKLDDCFFSISLEPTSKAIAKKEKKELKRMRKLLDERKR
jgi:hypothetical protein